MLGFRKAWRTAQFNQAFGQGTQSERRTFVPAPAGGINRSIPVHSLPQKFAVESSFVPTEIGLVGIKSLKQRAVLPESALKANTIIPFQGTATASSRLFMHIPQSDFWDVSSFIDSDLGTASVSASVSITVAEVRYDWIEVNNRLIMTAGETSSPPLSYRNGVGFETWSATASGDSINNMWGINQFKSRIYCWHQTEPEFYYGSTDAVLGTLEPFSLSTVVREGARKITTFFGMSRDGGSGPDDYATFVMDDGQVVVYQGSDPGDANNWSHIGTYKIGKPLGRNCAVPFGSQVAVMCQDDIYFLPQDLSRPKVPSPYARDRSALKEFFFDEVDGIFWEEKGWLMWEDGTIINTRLQGLPGAYLGTGNATAKFDRIAKFKGRVFQGERQGVTDDAILSEIQAASAPSAGGNIVTAPFRGQGRGNISLVNPIFQTTDRAGHITYRTGVTYDYSASASAGSPIFTTASASGDSTGIWQPGFGTGAAAQIHCTVVTASISTSADLVLVGFDLTYSDTGGL